jgi:hypothetical protein
MQACRDLGSRDIFKKGCNSVTKRPLAVSGHDAEVMMDLIEDELVSEGAPGLDAVHRSIAVRNQEVCLLSSQVIHLHRELAEANAEAECQTRS